MKQTRNRPCKSIKYIPLDDMVNMNFNQLKEAGLINENQLRYHQMREHAMKLHNDEGLTLQEASDKLAEIYFLSEASISHILYRRVK